MTPKIISFKNISFSYQKQLALTDVSFDIYENDFVGIVGPNGGGKTTLLKLIVGLLTPTSGEVSVLNELPRNISHRIGFMPQMLRFDPSFPISVFDVVAMGRLRPQKIFLGQADIVAIEKILSDLNLNNLKDRQFSTLSGGERQRVLMGRALVCDPELLIFDEPTAGVDAISEATFLELIKSFYQKKTMLMVSHDLNFITELVSNVLCVDREVHIHPTKDLSADSLLRTILGKDVRMIEHQHHCDENCLEEHRRKQ